MDAVTVTVRVCHEAWRLLAAARASLSVDAVMPWVGDVCYSMWEEAYREGRMVFPYEAHILEIGCAEADWIGPLREERPDVQVVGIDWRVTGPRPAAAAIIRGDVLVVDFEFESFDAIVGISSMEHIGLGHYEADPLDVDGDRHCAERIGRWLKPNGWFYADVPYDPAGFSVCDTSYRAYDDASLLDRLLPPSCRAEHVWHFPQTTGLAYTALLARK